jgi:hypothetical protein
MATCGGGGGAGASLYDDDVFVIAIATRTTGVRRFLERRGVCWAYALHDDDDDDDDVELEDWQSADAIGAARENDDEIVVVSQGDRGDTAREGVW